MEKDLTKIITNSVIIPKSAAWTFVLGIISAVIVAYVTLRVQNAHIEKDLATLQRDVAKHEISIKENKDINKDIRTELQALRFELKLKKDVKIVE